MAGFDTGCLMSTVRNTSGGRMRFGFLPPHGVELDANQEYTIFGDVQESVIRDNRALSRRNITALEDAINRGDIQIMSSPSPILRDGVTHAPRMLQVRSGAITAVDPCWMTSIPGPEVLGA